MTEKRAHADLEGELEEREQKRRETEGAEQQDLNQGMATGTYESTRHGVDWPSSYRRTISEIRKVSPTKEQIEARAFELYLQRGGADGRDLEDWFTAESELEQEHATRDSARLKTRAAAASG